MASYYINLPAVSGGTGAVDSVNGQTGVVILDATDLGLGNVDNTSDLDKPISDDTQDALDLKQDIVTAPNNSIPYFNGTSVLDVLPYRSVNPFYGVDLSTLLDFDNRGGGQSFSYEYYPFRPLQNSPNESWNLKSHQIEIDPDSDGFDMAGASQLMNYLNVYFKHFGTSDIGQFKYLNFGSDIGNGTDPFSINGIQLINGFTHIDDNITVVGQIQGYGVTTNIDSGAFINQVTQAFYDNSTYSTPSESYTTFTASQNISEMKNNHNYTGVNITPNIPVFTGNSGFNGVVLSGNLGTFDTGSYNGISINPTIAETKNANCIYVNTQNITPYAGSQSDLVFQDITLEFINLGDNNVYTFEYTAGGTAGSEVVSISGNAIEVQIESGVSTATQVKAAMDASLPFSTNISSVISGAGGNAQVAAGPTNFVNGSNPGSVYAAFLDGDVNITGSLTFGGALSIGKLSAFASQAVIDGGGNPQTVHGLITNPTIAANATIANGDTIGVNTAMLLNIGDNSTTTSGPFGLGMAALAFPTVVTTGAGSSLDYLAGAVFAINFDVGSTGGTIGQAYGARAVFIPNGVTTVTRAYGFFAHQPFGLAGTDNWGIYAADFEKNYLEGATKIGAGSDVPTAGKTLDVEGDTLLNGSVVVGPSGSVIQGIFSATATLDFPSIASNSYEELTMTVTGATVGSSVAVGAPAAFEANLIAFGFVTAADTVTIRVHNGSGGAVDPASATWRATVTTF